MKVKDLDRRHPEYQDKIDDWEKMNLLYVGGREIKKNAEVFLQRRPKELSDVFTVRVNRFTYHNHIGTAIDYYPNALFERPPIVECTSGMTTDVGQFYDQFQSDCDRCGKPLVERVREFIKNLLVFQSSFLVLDLPRRDMTMPVETLADELDNGLLNPYVTIYDPRQCINWSKDQYGRLKWVIFTVCEVRTAPFQSPVCVDKWYYFDETQYQVYECARKEDGKQDEDAEVIEVAAGLHALSQLGRVPVISFELPEGLWLMNRAFLPAQDHLNTDNVLSWALFMSALAMPVICTDEDFTPSLTEAGFIKLSKDSTYSWTEPEGTSFGVLRDRCSELKEDIYRSAYLVSQARDTSATPAAQSGVSKQQDMMPSKKMLNMLGDVARVIIQSTLDFCSKIRGNDLVWDVRGLEFPEEDPADEIALLNDAMTCDIPSPTLEKELYIRVANTLLQDANDTMKQKVRSEIESAPDKYERELQRMKESAKAMVPKFPKGAI